MKQLNMTEVTQVSGGDFEISITAHVDSGVSYWVTSLFSAIVTGQIVGTQAFADALNNAIANGANFNEFRIQSISYSNFN